MRAGRTPLFFPTTPRWHLPPLPTFFFVPGGAGSGRRAQPGARAAAQRPTFLTKSGRKGERLVPIPTWAVDMLRSRRARIGEGIEPVFPDSLGGWRDPSNVRRIWREVRNRAEIDGLVSHMLRKTVASFLDDAAVSARRISDQLGHSKVSMTQDRYLGRKLTDRLTADVLEGVFDIPENLNRPNTVPDESDTWVI